MCFGRFQVDTVICIDIGSLPSSSGSISAGTANVKSPFCNSGGTPGIFFGIPNFRCGGSCGPAGFQGDPHITPFFHQQYPFTLPEARRSLDVYNYITLPDFQQNCRVIKYPGHWNGEYVIETGFLVRDPLNTNATTMTIQVGPMQDAAAWKLSARVNGKTLDRTTVQTSLFTIEQRSVSQVTIEFAMLRVDVILHFAHALPYLDVKVDTLLPQLVRTAHGLLGQSARPNVPYKTPVHKECFACFVEGSMEDYRIQSGDLFGADFKHNLFQEKK